MSTGQKRSPSFSQTYCVRASNECGIGYSVPKFDELQTYTRLGQATLPPLALPRESTGLIPQDYLCSQSNLVLPPISQIEACSYKRGREDNLNYLDNFRRTVAYESSTSNRLAPLWISTEPHIISPSKTNPVISDMPRSIYSPNSKYCNSGIEPQPRSSPKHKLSSNFFQKPVVSPLQEPRYDSYDFNWTPTFRFPNPTGPNTILESQPSNNTYTFDFDRCYYTKSDSIENKAFTPAPASWPNKTGPPPAETQASTILPISYPTSVQFPGFTERSPNSALFNFDWRGLDTNVQVSRTHRDDNARDASVIPRENGGYYRKSKESIPPPPPSQELSPTIPTYNVTEVKADPSNPYQPPGLAEEVFYVAPNNDPEGHFRAKENDYITERFRVISSLGQGTFGSVFKCTDRDKKQIVAVKVVRNSPRYREAALNEYRVLQAIKAHDKDNVYHCVHVRECLEREAGNICLVFDLLGSSIYDFHSSNHFQSFPQEHIQQFALQILQSLSYFHHLGIIHTDLKPENIMLVSADYFSAPPKKKKRDIKYNKILTNTNIQVIDFGSAIFETDHHSSVVSTRHYRAPEIIMGLGWSFPCDIWSVGCILAELVTGEALFRTHDNVEHLAMMEAVLGPIPRSMAFQSNNKGQALFGPDGKLNFPTNETTKQSSKSVKNMKELNKIAGRTGLFGKHFTDLLKKMMTYSPEDRITAYDALQHPFFSIQFDKNGKANISQEPTKSPTPGQKREGAY